MKLSETLTVVENACDSIESGTIEGVEAFDEDIRKATVLSMKILSDLLRELINEGGNDNG